MDEYFLVSDFQPLIRISDGNYPMYMPQVRAANPNTSFPMPIRDYILEPFGFMPVFDSPDIEFDPNTSYLVEGPPEQNSENGKWYKTWVVTDYTTEELEQNLANAKFDLIDRAKGILINDLSTGIPYTLNNQDLLVDVSGDKLVLLLSVKSLAKDAQDTDTFQYSFMGEELLDLSKSEFLNMWTAVNNGVYSTNKNFWQYSEDVKSKTFIGDLPQVPATFKG